MEMIHDVKNFSINKSDSMKSIKELFSRYNDGSQIKTLRDEEMRNNLILNPSILHRYAKIPKSDGKLKFTLKFKNENQIVPNRDLKTVFLNLMIN